MRFRFIVILGMVLLLAGSAWADIRLGKGWAYGDSVGTVTWAGETCWRDGLIYKSEVWEIASPTGKDFLSIRINGKEIRIYNDGSVKVQSDEWVQIYPKKEQTLEFFYGDTIKEIDPGFFTLPYMPVYPPETVK